MRAGADNPALRINELASLLCDATEPLATFESGVQVLNMLTTMVLPHPFRQPLGGLLWSVG